MPKNTDELTTEEMDELTTMMRDSIPGMGQAPDFMERLKRMPGKISESVQSMVHGPQAVQMLSMYKTVGKEIAMQKAGQLLIDSVWDVVIANTEDLAAKYKPVHLAFHTKVGRAATTFLVIQLALFGIMLGAQQLERKGEARAVATLHVFAQILMYSVGTSVMGALNIEGLIKSAIGWASGICTKAGLDVDELASEVQAATK